MLFTALPQQALSSTEQILGNAKFFLSANHMETLDNIWRNEHPALETPCHWLKIWYDQLTNDRQALLFEITFALLENDAHKFFMWP